MLSLTRLAGTSQAVTTSYTCTSFLSQFASTLDSAPGRKVGRSIVGLAVLKLAKQSERGLVGASPAIQVGWHCCRADGGALHFICTDWGTSR
jgi:hypothetical protein